MTIRVYPGASNPTHEISLSDGVQTWGLRLDGGPEALKETPLTPSTLRFNARPSGFGEWEPGMAQIVQRDWSGGRGLETFSATDEKSANRFFDSMNAWTLTPGKLLPSPQWKLAQGLRASIQHLPGNVSWKALIGEQRFVSAEFTVGVLDLAAKTARMWIRRVGRPNELTLGIYTDDSGEPNDAIENLGENLSANDAPDVVSKFRGLALGLPTSLVGGNTYHLVVRGGLGDNAANHWEIGVEEKTNGGQVSGDGETWADAGFNPYFRIEDAEVKRTFNFFWLGGSLYAVDQRANGSASHLYLNGDHGLITSAAVESLTNTNRFWITNAWAGAWVRIVKGKGTGQAGEIISNTADTLTVAAWDMQPDATSEYSIYGTEQWTDITPSGGGDLIDGVVRDVAVVNDHALFAQGDAVAILRMRFNSALVPPRHEFDDDGTNMADLLHSFHHPVSGPIIWRALINAGEISRAVPANWATAMTFGTAIKVGEKSQVIHELFDWGSQLWVLKSDSFWQVNDSDQTKRVNAGLESLSKETQKPPLCIFGGQVVLGWKHDLVEFSGSSVSRVNVGGEQGLLAGRQGAVSAVQPLSAGRLALAVDAGAGESSVLLWEGDGWHELMRAPQAGQRIQSLAWQDFAGMRPRLWIGVNGDLACIEFPRETENPLGDSSLTYQHEGVLVCGTIDMGAVRLVKFLKELSLVTRNLGSGTRVEVDYQLDGEVNGPNWRRSRGFTESPLDTVPLNLGELQSILLRLRLLTDQATRPAIVEASVLEGFARTPLKYQWSMRIRVADLQVDPGGGLEADPEAFMAWLQQAARQARRIYMRAIWKGLDDKYVIVEPPTLLRQFGNSLLSWLGGVATVVVREG